LGSAAGAAPVVEPGFRGEPRPACLRSSPGIWPISWGAGGRDSGSSCLRRLTLPVNDDGTLAFNDAPGCARVVGFDAGVSLDAP